MKKVAIIGAGKMTKPMVDYFIDHCGYRVVMATRTLPRAQEIIGGRPLGEGVKWSSGQSEVLDGIIAESDIVISMVPKPVHTEVALSCLRHKTNMITTAYETPELLNLKEEAEKQGVLILNELGEVPGLDHFGTQLLLDEVKAEGGKIISLKSYGSGLPAFEHNNNPWLYKFSWDPATVFVAAQTGAAFYQKGRRVEVLGDKLFDDFKLVDIDGLGTFETYPNKDCKKYLEPFGLNHVKNLTFYRGLLRYVGYCNAFRETQKLGFFDNTVGYDFTGKTHRRLLAEMIAEDSTQNLESKVADFLDVYRNADIIHRLKWLGLFKNTPIPIKNGTKLDVLLDLMQHKMVFAPHEKDMIILHIELIVQFSRGRREKRLCTMLVKGTPGGDSAMSRAVALPAAISARLIMEGKIKGTGLRMPPNMPELYRPVLAEMETYGYAFKRQTIPLSAAKRNFRNKVNPNEKSNHSGSRHDDGSHGTLPDGPMRLPGYHDRPGAFESGKCHRR